MRTLNTYSLNIHARCPADGTLDLYDLVVEGPEMLAVETLLEIVRELTDEPIYQEDLTERLAERLAGWKVTLRGDHSRVRVWSEAETG